MNVVTSELSSALSGEFQFVMASISTDPNQGETWWADPTGGKGKGEPTTDPDHASAMVAALDAILASQGPFYGILGYSQGSAAIPVYLSQVATGTFQIALMFCGYLTTTHTGLLNRVNAASPFGGIRALVFMGQQDTVITNAQTQEQATVFTSPTVLSSPGTGHTLPSSSDATLGITRRVRVGAGSRLTRRLPSGSARRRALARARRCTSRRSLGAAASPRRRSAATTGFASAPARLCACSRRARAARAS